MKGLILKDWYLMIKYCKSFLLIIILFTLFSFQGDENAFFIMYPCVMAGMIPLTLCSYDEREKWCTYSLTLPVSKTQYVSAKYTLGLLINVTIIVMEGIALACRMLSTGTFEMIGYMSTMGVLVSATMLLPSMLMPCVYKVGTEKARIIYIVGVAIAFGASVGFAMMFERFGFDMGGAAGVILLVVGLIVLYAASWLISIRFYNNREL